MQFFSLHQWDPKSLAALDGSVLELISGKKTPATTLLESKHKHINPENGMVGTLVFACFLGANSLLVPGRVRHSSFKAPLNFLSWGHGLGGVLGRQQLLQNRLESFECLAWYLPTTSTSTGGTAENLAAEVGKDFKLMIGGSWEGFPSCWKSWFYESNVL